MKRKVLSVLLAAIMMAVSLVGCGNAEESGNVEKSVEGEQGDKEPVSQSGETHKIGFTYWSCADPYGALMIQDLQECCDAVGWELVTMDWVTMDYEGMVQAYKQMIDQGCDGIVTTMMTPGLLNLCEQTGTTFVMSHAKISDAELLQTAMESGLFAGTIMADDYQAGYDMAKALYEAGCKEQAYCGPAQGTTTQADDSYDGMVAFLDETADAEMMTELKADDPTNAVSQVLAAFPEVQGIMTRATGQVEAMYNEGTQDRVKIAAVDMDPGIADQAMKDGVLVYYAPQDASAAIVYMAFGLLYNEMTGHPMVDDKSEVIKIPYRYITTYDEFNAYNEMKETEGSFFTAEDIKSMLVDYNADASLDTFEKLENKLLGKE